MGRPLRVLEGTAAAAAAACGAAGGPGGELWLVGVLCSCVGSVATALGNVLQKRAQVQQQARPAESRFREPVPGIILSPLWLCGLVVVGLLPIPLEVAAFSLAAQSVIQPLGAVTLVMTQLLGPRMLEGEHVSRRDHLAGLVMVCGIVLTTVFGSHAEQQLDMAALLALWRDTTTIVMESVAFVSIVLCAVLVNRLNRRLGRLEPFLYAYVAGALGAQMNILFKGAAELVAGSISGQVTSFRDDTLRSLLWIAGTIALAVMQISYINQGLQRFDCVLFSPLYSAWLMVCGVTWGGTYYQEFRCLDALGWSMFLLGLAITLAGIATLLWDKTHLRDIKRVSGEHQERLAYPAEGGAPYRDDASVGTLEADYAGGLADSGAEPISPDDGVALARA